MMCQLTPGGRPTDYMIAYYETKAKGGAAVVTVGDTPVDEEHAPSIPVHPVLKEEHMTVFAELAKAIKQHGAIASLELNHGGRASLPWFNPVGPVSFTREDGVKVTGMDRDMIEHVADNYAKAAKFVKSCGFDMCLLHGAHGWLLGQFLSPLFNTRTDEFGGPLENRAKFPLMVLDRVREAVGENFVIEYRLSGNELIEGGLSTEEAVLFAQMIESKIDLLHVSVALDTTREQAVMTHPTIFLPHGVNVKYAEEIKKHVSLPVVTVGAISDPAMAEDIIASGKADVVAMARALIADPQFPNKSRKGKTNEITPCLRCLDCLALMHTESSFSCAVNPCTGREFRLNTMIKPATQKKKVLVIGGGPGGMMAAITATERGHDVVLAEKSDSLGGLLKFTDYDSVKGDLMLYKNYLIRKTERSGADVRLNTEADAAFAKSIGADAIVLATGSIPIVPKISGLVEEGCMHATDIYTNMDKLGKKVVVIGGGLVGCETALYLAEEGREAVIVEMLDRLAPDSNWMHHEGMMQSFKRHNVTSHTGVRCTGISDKGVTVEKSNGETILIEADSVVYAVGMQSENRLTAELADAAEDVIAIGDCVRPRKAKEAVYEAYYRVCDLA